MSGLAYADFLASKRHLADSGGFEPEIPDHLFDFQKVLVEWAVRQGRAALFADCGLGKTPMELAWAENVHRHTGRPVLLLTPLAVGFQIVGEAGKFGHDAAQSRNGKVAAPITVTNYEQIEKFDPADFAGVVCDESSAIKAFDGERRAQVTEFMRTVPYRLLGTATAAPNDHTELGTSAEALGHLGHTDMLSRFFTNNQRTTTSRSAFAAGGNRDVGWRLKGHAEEPFWRWVASWARSIRRPSDFGFSDEGFLLPELVQRDHFVDVTEPDPDALFDVPAHGLHEQRAEARRSLTDRCEKAAEVLEHAAPGVAWCNLNDEARLLVDMIDGAVEVAGTDSPGEKEEKLLAFTAGEIRVLVTKPVIGAWGLNWQHCHQMTYFPSHSFEQFYQAVRRSWRFGQQHPVEVDVITTEGGRAVLGNLKRKADQADVMFDALMVHMNRALHVDTPNTFEKTMELPPWLSN